MFEDLLNKIHTVCFIGINHNNDKYTKLFCYNLVNIILKTGWYIKQTKRYYLILVIIILNPIHYLLFIFLLNLYPILQISQVELYKVLSLTQSIYKLVNQGLKILILKYYIVKTLVIDIHLKTAIRFLNKKDKKIYRRYKKSYSTIG